jgi:hypothetical protein
MAKKSEFGEGREFFSEWHRDAYVDGCEREVLAAQARCDELDAVDAESATVAAKAAKERLANAKRELKRVTGQQAAAKRPAGADKETR